MGFGMITFVQIYGAIGALVAVAFLFWGIDRVAPDARGAYVFRPLLVPGILLVWPLVLWRWLALEQQRGSGQRRHRPPRRTQDMLAVVMALLIPIILITALLVRQQRPFEWPAIVVEEPAAGEASQ